jgi:hypothetical protein
MQPLGESGIQDSDVGHNFQWGTPGPVATDIASFIRTGKPTHDLPYADPQNVRNILVEKDGATILGSKK